MNGFMAWSCIYANLVVIEIIVSGDERKQMIEEEFVFQKHSDTVVQDIQSVLPFDGELPEIVQLIVFLSGAWTRQ